MKVLIACGGTGGHLFPGVAVAETLVRRQHKVKLLVSERALEQEVLTALPLCAESHRVGVQAIAAIGFSGSSRLIPFCYRLAQAVGECGAILREFQPDVVLGMGGYTSAPAILAARLFRRGRTATLIHESNAVPGKANQMVGRWVKHVAVGLPACGASFPRQPVTVTGTPIRSGLRGGEKSDRPHERLGLRPGRRTVLIMGGSQGARALNEAMACTLPWIKDRSDRIQFLHLSGPKDEQFVRDIYDKNGFHARVLGFCHEMDLAYSAADLVIARAGAATLAELAAYGLPAVLVPYPHATGQHQWHNARAYERAGAARVLPQSELETGLHAARGERLAGLIVTLLDKDDVRAPMAAAARSLAVPDAADRIVELVETTGRGSKSPVSKRAVVTPATAKCEVV